MHETQADLKALQDLLDHSFAGAGEHLRSIFGNRMNAEELVAALDGIFEVHLAALAGDGSPLVAPIDAILFKGRVWFGLPAQSLRARLVERDPRISASYTRDSFALIVHGGVEATPPGTPLAHEIDEAVTDLYVQQYGPGFLKWRAQQRERQGDMEGFSGFIEPRVMFAKA